MKKMMMEIAFIITSKENEDLIVVDLEGLLITCFQFNNFGDEIMNKWRYIYIGKK